MQSEAVEPQLSLLLLPTISIKLQRNITSANTCSNCDSSILLLWELQLMCLCKTMTSLFFSGAKLCYKQLVFVFVSVFLLFMLDSLVLPLALFYISLFWALSPIFTNNFTLLFQKERRQWDVYYTSHQSFIKHFLIRGLNNFVDLNKFWVVGLLSWMFKRFNLEKE